MAAVMKSWSRTQRAKPSSINDDFHTNYLEYYSTFYFHISISQRSIDDLQCKTTLSRTILALIYYLWSSAFIHLHRGRWGAKETHQHEVVLLSLGPYNGCTLSKERHGYCPL